MSAGTEIQTIKAAKKNHVCSYCGTRIAEGETYKRYRYFDGGDADTVKIHPECLDAFDELEWCDKQGGFLQGENPRGCNCGFEKDCDRCAAMAKEPTK